MSGVGAFYYSLCSLRAGHLAARCVVRALRRLGLLREFCLPLEALELDHESVRGLMQLWRRIHWSPGDGMMPADQLLTVYRLAATWPVPGDVAELGAWVGLTTAYLAAACRVRGEGHVYAVDTFAGTKEGGTTYPSVERFGGSTLSAFKETIAHAEVADGVTPLMGLTTQVAASYAGRPIRLLLIDADHSFDGVRNDYLAWLDHVAPGGLIVFHDYQMRDVRRFVDAELRRDARILFRPGLVHPNVVAVSRATVACRRAADVLGPRAERPIQVQEVLVT